MCQISTVYFYNDKEEAFFFIQATPSEVQDKINFIMNNVSATNVESNGRYHVKSRRIEYF